MDGLYNFTEWTTNDAMSTQFQKLMEKGIDAITDGRDGKESPNGFYKYLGDFLHLNKQNYPSNVISVSNNHKLIENGVLTSDYH